MQLTRSHWLAIAWIQNKLGAISSGVMTNREGVWVTYYFEGKQTPITRNLLTITSEYRREIGINEPKQIDIEKLYEANE